MQSAINTIDQKKYDHFSILRDQLEQKRNSEIAQRLAKNPSPTPHESILGAFIEMYEPHIRPIILKLLNKGYVLDISSGFCGKYYECQALTGSLPIDDIVINKLAKQGAKVQKNVSFKSIKFWPDSASISSMQKKYKEIGKTLPHLKELPQPSQTTTAAHFRMTYIPKNVKLKKQRLFEILMFTILKDMVADLKKRLGKHTKPDKHELSLGVFREMLEPQVRDAVLNLNKKGYSTDASGFMHVAHFQAIDGDFTIDEASKSRLAKIGVTTDTNHSGYTRLQFWPAHPDIKAIKKTWNMAVSLLPDKKQTAPDSMIRRAREFRTEFR